MKSLLRGTVAVRDLVEPLWPAGLAVVLLQVSHLALPLTGERYEWTQYCILGVVFPIIVLVANWGWSAAWGRGGTARTVRAFLALASLWPLNHLLGNHAGLLVLLLAAAQGLGVGVLLAVRARGEAGGARGGSWTSAAVGAALLLFCWIVAARWLWWESLSAWVTGSAYSAFAVLGAVVLSVWCFAGLLTRREGGIGGKGQLAARLRDLVALVILGLASVLVPGQGMQYTLANYYGPMTHHHWGALVGPSQCVREGGWLLWDTPSQYGFLNTLAVAALPISDIWQAAYTFNAILYFLAGTILFWLMRSLRPGAAHHLFSLLVTLAALYLLPGSPQDLTGPFITPAVGPFRFFWCYALVAVLAWEHRLALRGSTSRAPLWVGCLAWLAGSFWSAESFVFSAVVWLPAYGALVLRRLPVWHTLGGWRPKILTLAIWLCLPVLLGCAAVAALDVVYVVVLKHPPDWEMFIEYCRTLGVIPLPIEPHGAVWVLVLVFVAVATAAASVLRGPQALRDLPLLLGAGGALWAGSSYYVGRSHEINTTNLSPLVLLAIAGTLHVLAHREAEGTWPIWVRLSFLPVVTMILVGAFGNGPPLLNYGRALARGYRRHMSHQLPLADPTLTELLTDFGVGPRTPLLYVDNRPLGLNSTPVWRAGAPAGPRVTAPAAWMPGAVMTVYIPLREERRRLYFTRFAARTRHSGWLLEINDPIPPELAWITDQLRQSHRPGPTIVRGGWRLTWYEYRDGAAFVAGE